METSDEMRCLAMSSTYNWARLGITVKVLTGAASESAWPVASGNRPVRLKTAPLVEQQAPSAGTV